ncbi:MAG: 3D domain-containing protein, partial [Limnochordia bacterium]
MKATAYTAGYESTGKWLGHPAYGVTYTGALATEGRTIAVDPAIIPLGSWVYIEGHGLFHAEDTGGAIKGNRVDIFMDDVNKAISFGVQEVELCL